MITKYQNKTFKTKATFKTWLKQTTKYKITFEDQGQDFLTWHVASNKEVIHSEPGQAGVWSGTIVEDMKVGERPIITTRFGDEVSLKYKITGIWTKPDLVISGPVTKRESEILALVRDGLSNPEIAEVLCISPKTVENHIRNALIRLKAKNRTHAVVECLRLGVFELEGTNDAK